MNSIKKISLILLAFIISSLAIAQDKALFEMKPVQTLVYDNVGFFPQQDKQYLEQKLINLDSETSIQILVAVVPDLMGYDKSDYATRLGHKWGVGGKEDNGFVILIKPKTNTSKGEVFIAPGYGVEQYVTDALAKTIVDNEMIPAFKTGNYSQGVDNAINTIISLTSGEFTGSQYLKKHKKKSSGFPVGIIIIIVIAIISFFGSKGRNNHTGMGGRGSSLPFWLLMGASMGGGRSSGGFGGFSSGGGSFGGFGGGGFGGGGAGGSW